MKFRAFLLGLWCLAIASGMAISNYQPSQYLQEPQMRTRNDALLDVLGQSRTLLARYLWFKMDIFHEVLDVQGVATESQAQVLPLLRLVTLLDPTLTDAYDIMVYDLVRGHNRVDQALELLDEGLERNPQDAILLMRKALILINQKRHAEAVIPADKATRLVTDEFDILNANRLLYWSAKEVKRKDLMAKALNVLISMRPEDNLWRREAEALKSL